MQVPAIGQTLSREFMPQIKNIPDFLDELELNGIAHTLETLNPHTLKSTQSEFDANKVFQMMQSHGERTPIIVSKDGYVLDGHHRWLEAHNKCENVDAHVCDASILDLLHHAKRFCSTRVALKEGIEHKDFGPMLDSFVSFASEKLGLKSLPNIRFKGDADKFNSFAAYTPGRRDIIVTAANRHPMDVFRSVAHELVHQHQDERGALYDGAGETGSPIEDEANYMAGRIMRLYAQNNPSHFELKHVKEQAIVIGGPCSGKDRAARHLTEQGVEVISMDAYDLTAIQEQIAKMNDPMIYFIETTNDVSKARNEARAAKGQRVLAEGVRFQKFVTATAVKKALCDQYVVHSIDNSINEERPAHIRRQFASSKTIDTIKKHASQMKIRSEPLYHGSDRPLEKREFEIGRKTQNSLGPFNYETERHGSFFSDNSKFSQMYGKNVSRHKLKVNKTYDMTTNDYRENFKQTIDPHGPDRSLWLQAHHATHAWNMFDDDLGKRFVAHLKSKGYDSAKFKEIETDEHDNEHEGMTYVVFHQKHIKNLQEGKNDVTVKVKVEHPKPATKKKPASSAASAQPKKKVVKKSPDQIKAEHEAQKQRYAVANEKSKQKFAQDNEERKFAHERETKARDAQAQHHQIRAQEFQVRIDAVRNAMARLQPVGTNYHKVHKQLRQQLSGAILGMRKWQKQALNQHLPPKPATPNLNEAFESMMEHAGEWGTDELRSNYQKDTPGQPVGFQEPFSNYLAKNIEDYLAKKKADDSKPDEPNIEQMPPDGMGQTVATNMTAWPQARAGIGGIAEHIKEWAHNQNTVERYKARYPKNWESKILETARFLNSQDINSKPKFIRDIQEAIDKGVGDMGTVPNQNKEDQPVEECGPINKRKIIKRKQQ